jgi:ribosomal protein L29
VTFLNVFFPDIDEIRGKSKNELRELIQELQGSLHHIQEQSNYWLDAKEQLMMDAEMHNKMIASLVTYAQQQQISSSKCSLW